MCCAIAVTCCTAAGCARGTASCFARRVPTRLPGLEPSTVSVESPVHLAQRYLASAYDSVASLIETTYPVLRSVRHGSRGRLTHAEQDLFRAAVVFAGAGVDAVLKEALRSCVPIQVASSSGAREKYLEFVTKHLQDGAEFHTRRLAELIVSESPGHSLRDSYIQSLTGSSLQSQQQVTSSLAALGLQDERDLFKDSRALNPLFRARNEIAHEMDMTAAAVRDKNRRTRRERSLSSYVAMCHAGLNYCQRVLNALEAGLSTDN